MAQRIALDRLLVNARSMVRNCLRRLDEGDVDRLTLERFNEWYAAAQARADELEARLEILRDAALAQPLETLIEINYDIDKHPELTGADIAKLDIGQARPGPEEDNSEIDRAPPPGVDGADGDRGGREETMYEKYRGLTLDDSEIERDRDDGRSR
jgi:hypothetical protein